MATADEPGDIARKLDTANVGLVGADGDRVADPDSWMLAAARNQPQFAAMRAGLLQRANIAKALGQQFGGDRDIYDVAGYEKQLDSNDYWAKYLRQDIARTIVDAPAKASWRAPPVITDDPDTEENTTPFDEAIQMLFDVYGILNIWERVDRLAGLGNYAVLYIGVADADRTDSLAEPVDIEGFQPLSPSLLEGGLIGREKVAEASGLAFFAPYSQRRIVGDPETVEDQRDPRFGLPASYEVEFDTENSQFNEDVHWSRVIHVAQDVLEDDVFGLPQLEAVYNRLEDLEKVIAASAETYWRTAAPRWKASTKDGTKDIRDKDDLKDEIESLIHGLDLVAYLRNVELEPIEGKDVNPTGVVDKLIELIAGETGIPQRMLTGSERGELASTQDRATFFERIGERQQKFCEPNILRPTIDRLIEFGFIPEPQDGTYVVEWPELFQLNEVERSQVRAQNARALKDSAPMGDTSIVVTVPEIREEFLGLPPARGEASSLPEEDMLEEDEFDEDDELQRLLDELMDREDIDVEIIDGPLPGGDSDESEAGGPGVIP